MKDNTNAIDTMLCLQKADMPTSTRSIDLNTWYLDEQSNMPNHSYSEESDEQALTTINQCIRFFGHSATKELEGHLELLQEEFLAHLEELLQNNEINIQEKLTISLSSDNQLILQCQEQEEAILAALGTDDPLLKHLQALRKVALISRGLDYILSVQHGDGNTIIPQYNVCTKGALSHFYLK